MFSFFYDEEYCHADAIINIFEIDPSQKNGRSYFAGLEKRRHKIFATQSHPRDHNATVCLPSAHTGCKKSARSRNRRKALNRTEQNYALQSPRSIHYCSLTSTIFSLSLRLFFWSLRACLRSFSSLRLIALISSPLISPAFLTCLGTCLCLPIRRISGMCL